MQELQNIKVAEFPFRAMSYFGAWKPNALKSVWTVWLYSLYTIIILVYKFYFSITFLINICLNKDDPDIFIENIFFFTSAILIPIKIVHLNIHRRDVNAFMSLVLQTNCLPRNDEEAVIYKNFQDKERLVLHFY